MMPKATAVVASLFWIAACSGSRAPVAADLEVPAGEAELDGAMMTAGPDDECLQGVWTVVEQGRTRTFRFFPDHTGEEVRTATDTRRFMWRIRPDGTVRVIEPEALDEDAPATYLVVDCAAATLRAGGKVFAKQE